jgi:protein involved in polysaccharide export with SLBB domain
MKRRRLGRPALGLVALALGLAGAGPATAQRPDDLDLADRPLASRAALEALARHVEASGRRDGRTEAALARLRARLAEGDFRPGDRVVVEVLGESTLTDTFAVTPQRTLVLPSPAVGALPLQGVLRVEIQEHVAQFVARFVQRPSVRAWATMRLSFQGEVVRAGFYSIPPDAVLADALMAAGGTTREADLEKVRIERDGRRIWQGKLQDVVAGGRTLEGAELRDGDQIVVPRRREGDLGSSLRFLWVVVSLVGGVYGISRAL